MKCPICGCEMQEGGIIASGIAVSWHPEEEFKQSALKTLGFYSDGVPIGHSNLLTGQTKIQNAFLCENCKKVVGVFDITQDHKK